MNIKTLKQIINDNGATINKNGIAKNFSSGWQVSKKDCFTLDINNTKAILNAINQTLQTISKNEFLGLWIDNGKIYVDISIKINNKKIAIEYGKQNKQISIFNWYNKKCLYLKY